MSDTIELILDSIEDTIRGNIEFHKSPFEMDVQRIIDYCRKRKKEILREFLEKPRAWETIDEANVVEILKGELEGEE